MKRILLLVIVALGLAPYCARADENITLKEADNRYFSVHLPPQYKKGTSLPMVLVLHGGGGSIDGMKRMTGMNDAADKYGFIAVYPAGSGRSKKSGLTWNAGLCCGYAMQHKVDDVAFISAVIDTMIKNYGVDRQGVYATGISNGAQMSYRLACELSDKIAAIAPVAGQPEIDPCTPKHPVAILHFHGTADQCSPYEGGEKCGGCYSKLLGILSFLAPHDTWSCPSVTYTISQFEDLNRCTHQYISYSGEEVECVTHDKCLENADVVLCTIKGGGHTWPGGDNDPEFCHRQPHGPLCRKWRAGVGTSTNEINASATMLEFFAEHPLPN